MADLCIECERLWSEYSSAMHKYLSITREVAPVPLSGQALHSVTTARRELQPTVTALRKRISQHELAAHSHGC